MLSMVGGYKKVVPPWEQEQEEEGEEEEEEEEEFIPPIDAEDSPQVRQEKLQI
jgi:hypothetical protein